MRYFFLQTHYQKVANFTWEGAKSAQNSYNNLKKIVLELQSYNSYKSYKSHKSYKTYHSHFVNFISDNLQIPNALALLWQAVKDQSLNPQEKLSLIYDFDKVFGLKLTEIKAQKIPQEIIKLAEERKRYRMEKNFQKADEIRKKIETLGYQIEDLPQNQYKIKIK